MKKVRLGKYYKNFSYLYENITGLPADDEAEEAPEKIRKRGKSLEELLQEIGTEVSSASKRLASEGRRLSSISSVRRRIIIEEIGKEAEQNPSFKEKCKEAWTKIVGAAGLLGRVDNINSFTDQICGLLGLESSANPASFASFIRRYDNGNRPSCPAIFIVEGRALQRYFEENYIKKAKTDFEKIMAYVQCTRDLKAFKEFYLNTVSMTPRQEARKNYPSRSEDPGLFDGGLYSNATHREHYGTQTNVKPTSNDERQEMYMSQLKKVMELKEGNPDTDFDRNKFGQFIGLGKKYIKYTEDKINPNNPMREYPLAFIAYDSKLDDKLDTVFTVMPGDVSNPDDTSAVADKIGTIVASIIDPKAIKNS